MAKTKEKKPVEATASTATDSVDETPVQTLFAEILTTPAMHFTVGDILLCGRIYDGANAHERADQLRGMVKNARSRAKAPLL